MCGIWAAVRTSDKQDLIQEAYEGISELSYRGYDSFGIAWPFQHGISFLKTLEFDKLKESVGRYKNIKAATVMAHCRWSSTGRATIENTHPIFNGNYGVVHNGTIENWPFLRGALENEKIKFTSDTDSEMIPALFNRHERPTYFDIHNVISQTQMVNSILQGDFAYVVMSRHWPNLLILSARNTPLYFTNTGYVASDHNSLRNKANTFFEKVNNDEIVILQYNGDKPLIHTFTLKGSKQFENLKFTNTTPPINSLEGDRMLAEIQEQPELVRNFQKQEILHRLSPINHFKLLGCGSSYNAALLGTKYFNNIGLRKATAYYASEREDITLEVNNSAYILISQSGASYDILEWLRQLKKENEEIYAITNNLESTLGLEVKNKIDLKCGQELAVASTKSFLLTCLHLLSQGMWYWEETEQKATAKLANNLKMIIDNKLGLQNLSNVIKNYSQILVMGTSYNYPIAREIALKFSEVANIHSQGIPSAEIKHGPMALINDKTLAIFLLGPELNRQVQANIEQVLARNGTVVTIGPWQMKEVAHSIVTPIAPSICGISMQHLQNVVVGQLLSYYTAKAKGLNADRPANLAKVSTVI